jgi:NitT/TauT family transport system permease protein
MAAAKIPTTPKSPKFPKASAPLGSRAMWRGALGIATIFLLWELLTRAFSVPAYVLPSVSSILAAIGSQRAILGPAAATTFFEALAGFGAGSACGLLLAVALTLLPPVRKPMLPLVTALNSVPVVAYAPLILLWFGIGPTSKVIMVAIAVGFTVFLHALAGMARVDPRVVDLMRSFGSSPMAILWRIRIPAAIPLTAAGMRVSTTRAVIVAIVTEMLGAQRGLGWTIYQAVLQIDFVQVWSAIFVASAGSLLFFGLVNFLEKRYVFWK